MNTLVPPRITDEIAEAIATLQAYGHYVLDLDDGTYRATWVSDLQEVLTPEQIINTATEALVNEGYNVREIASD